VLGYDNASYYRKLQPQADYYSPDIHQLLTLDIPSTTPFPDVM
jgi:hypothetical protein